MKKTIALILILLGIGFHAYLSLHYYELNYGLSTGESVCNLSSTFNCDTVSASQFSSLFNMPMALWGLVTNGVLAILLIGWILGWSDNLNRLGHYVLVLSGFVALVSVVMGSLSVLFVKTYCLFCIGAYLTSFASFGLIWSEQTDLASLKSNLLAVFKDAKSYLAYVVAIPVITFLVHSTYVQKVGAQNLGSIVNSSVSDWQSRAAVDFSAAPPSLVSGPDSAPMIITEFADFTCGHCKNASPGLKAFANSRSSSVQLRFYTFPLDSSCNEAIPGGGNGLPCYLAKQTYCAEKTAQKGWAMHDFIFANQEKINSNRSLEWAKGLIAGFLKDMGIDESSQNVCLESPDTDSVIRSQAKLASASGVNGTPTFFVNGKKLSRGHCSLYLNQFI